jgi:hypothetical protein
MKICQELGCDNDVARGYTYCRAHNAAEAEGFLKKRQDELAEQDKNVEPITRLLALCREGIALFDKQAEAWNDAKSRGVDADAALKPHKTVYERWLLKHGPLIMGEILKLRENA